MEFQILIFGEYNATIWLSIDKLRICLEIRYKIGGFRYEMSTKY